MWIDKESKIVQWNTAAENIFGFKRTDVMGRSLIKTIIPDKHRTGHMVGMSNFLKTGRGQLFGETVEINAMTWSGDEIAIAISINAIIIDEVKYFTSHIRALDDPNQSEREARKVLLYADFPGLVPMDN